MDIGDLAASVDHEDRPSIEPERSENVVRLADFFGFVGEERKGEPALLLSEALMALDALRRNRHETGIEGQQFVEFFGVRVQLRGANGSVVAGIEHEDDGSPAEFLERIRAHPSAGKLKIRSDVADRQGHQEAAIAARTSSEMSKFQ